MAKTLVIVESPAKARTIERILKDGYEVRASYGHVRDLPESADEIPDEIRKKKWGRLGVDTEGDFTPYYVIPNDKKKYVQALRVAMKGATQVYLATDPDREGESISWHLKEILKPKVPVKRIVFHEITEEAIKQAVKDAQDVDQNLVRAQESRRILDRLYGYTISPVLWKKVQTGLSAGRVQSVAVRLIVDREEERLKFRAATYWDIRKRFRRQRRADRQERARALGDRYDGARRCALETPALGGDGRRGEAGRRAPRAAVHDVDAHAGSEPQARLLDRAHDAGRAAAVPGRPHLVPPHRFDDAEREGAE
jgi:DNA topoisomerase-1